MSTELDIYRGGTVKEPGKPKRLAELTGRFMLGEGVDLETVAASVAGEAKLMIEGAEALAKPNSVLLDRMREMNPDNMTVFQKPVHAAELGIRQGVEFQARMVTLFLSPYTYQRNK